MVTGLTVRPQKRRLPLYINCIFLYRARQGVILSFGKKGRTILTEKQQKRQDTMAQFVM